MPARTLALCVIFAVAEPAMAQQTCLPYEAKSTSISGQLSEGHGYGPPNFGEDPAHDQKETYGLLTLDRAVCVSGGKDMDQPVKSIQAFQLVPNPDVKARLDYGLIGKKVTVTGTLFHRVSGGHTDVMIMFTKISPKNSK